MRAAKPFAIAVLLGSPFGALLARPTSSTTLMIVFALLNIGVGLLVLRGRSMVKGEISQQRELAICLLIGFGVGFMIGFVARDGGPFTMAILVLMGYEAKKAAGTAPVIVAAGCLVAFIIHAFDMTVGWALILAVAIASLIGSQIGAHFMSTRLESQTIRKLFAAVMFAVGVVILIQAL